MTKNLKAILSLFLAISLLLSLFPAAFAEEEITQIESSDIARLPLGNASGRLIEAGMTVSYGNGTTMENAKYLVDGFHFSVPEVITYSSIDINQNTSSVTVTTPDNQSVETGTISMTEDNNIIEVNYPEKKNIKRLELWVWPVGAIKDYTIQYFDGSDWVDHYEGSFDQTRTLPDSSTTVGKSAVSYIVNFPAVDTTGIRFVVTGFQEGVAEAKIAEAVLRSNDTVNLLANDGVGNGSTSNSWLYNGNNGFVRQASPYAWKFGLSGIETDKGIWWSLQDSDARINAFPPLASSNASSARNVYPYTKNGVTHFWYGLTLTKSPQKVNKIAFKVAGTGTVNQVEIYQSNLETVAWPKLNAKPSGQGWEKVATVDCNVSSGETAEIYLPYAESAEHWVINISKWTESPQMRKPEIYVLGDTADFPAVSKAASEIFDSLETDSGSDDAIHRAITLKSDYTDDNGNEYDVDWSFESDNEDLLSKDGETLKIGFHESEEKVRLSAKLTSKTDNSVSYTASKEYTLLPVLNELEVILPDTMEGDASVLNDGVYFSPYETVKNPTELPSDNSDKMIKVLSEGGYIDYNWLTEDNASSLDLWIYPQGAVKDWEIQYSDDGVNYNTYTSGSFSEESISDTSAGCYSIIFEEKLTKHIRFLVKNFNEGFDNAYITESKVGKKDSIDYLETVEGDDAYSHFMKGYVSSPVSGSNAGASKNQIKVWPVENGENLGIVPDNGFVWYATGFSVPSQKINRVVVPINAGSAKKVELLVATGQESGFDYENSSFPACPDTLAAYKSVATVSGEFEYPGNVTIDIPNGISAKYYLVKITGASNNAQIGKPFFIQISENELSQTLLAANAIFGELITDGNADNEIKKKINLCTSLAYDGKTYSVTYTADNNLLDIGSGDVAYHDAQDTVTITATIKESQDSEVSYCVSKTYTLLGMQSIFVLDKDGVNKNINCNSVNDEFYYVKPESTTIPKYELDTLVGLEEGDSLVFSWDIAKSLTRFEMWNWPIDAILKYTIEISEDGENWTEHYKGEVVDQFKDDPAKRPTASAPESDYSNFYNIVFDEPTGNVRYIRFKVDALREGLDKAYILEARFDETNNVNFLMADSIKGSEKDRRSNSRYVAGNRNSIIGAYAAHETYCWPRYSTGACATVPISAGKDGYIWYATGFAGAPVALNSVTLQVGTGTVYEYEVLYSENYTTNAIEAGLTWDKNNGQADPATLKDFVLAARVSGEFKSGKPSQIHFDNEFPAKYWLVRVTSASQNATVSSVGMYQLSKAELSTSCYDAVLDSVFEGISDTAIDNVVSEKLNLRSSVQMDANGDGINETYMLDWSDNKGIVNTDKNSPDYGTFTIGEEDVEIELSAYIYLNGETSKHVRRKNFVLRGKDNRKLTTLLSESNIVLSENSNKTCDATIGSGYEYEGKKIVEIAFSNESLQNGTIQVMSKDQIVAELPVTDSKILYNGTEIQLDSKILIETEDNFFTVSKYGAAGYEAKIYNESFTQDLPFEKIRFVTGASQSVGIDLTVKVISEDLFSAVSDQFDFSKISPSYRATNLNGNLSFVDMIADIELKVESGDSSVVEIDDENNIGIVKSGTTTITTTLTSTSTGATHSESFEVIAGKDNIAGEASSTSPAVPVDGTNAVFALDGNLETEFLTDNKSWNLNINLLSEKAFNKLCIYLPKGANGRIESFKLLKSSDNIDYEEVCTITEFEEGVAFEIPYTEAQFLRLAMVCSGTKAGVRDICIYNEMTDVDKLEYDFEKLTENLTVKDGTIIPKKGHLGTSFTLSSNNDAVKIQETEDKQSWKVVADKVSTDTNVTVTLSSQIGALEPLTKSYSILLIGEVIVDDNTIPGTNNNGFGNGGLSGGGGGGGGSSSSSPEDKPEQKPQITDPVIVAPTEGIAELNNHWAEKEIKTLIAKQIVTGDGKSLNLDKNVTRAEFCKMLVVGLGLEQVNYQGSFSDISGDEWFASYAETAIKNNIMSGDGSGFRGNDVITRQEVAVVISNLLKNMLNQESDSSESGSAAESNFTDNNLISDWAIEHVANAEKAGIIKGYENGDFRPLNSLKRDESMVVVYRILSYIEK